jgi:hypothetical protein
MKWMEKEVAARITVEMTEPGSITDSEKTASLYKKQTTRKVSSVDMIPARMMILSLFSQDDLSAWGLNSPSRLRITSHMIIKKNRYFRYIDMNLPE